jgi:hypothetical protein
MARAARRLPMLAKVPMKHRHGARGTPALARQLRTRSRTSPLEGLVALGAPEHSGASAKKRERPLGGSDPGKQVFPRPKRKGPAMGRLPPPSGGRREMMSTERRWSLQRHGAALKNKPGLGRSPAGTIRSRLGK